MTLNQFAKLTPEEQQKIIDLLPMIRRRYLNTADHILETKFRLVDSSAWNTYKRPEDAKASRNYDYIHGTHKFLWNLEHKLKDINCK